MSIYPAEWKRSFFHRKNCLNFEWFSRKFQIEILILNQVISSIVDPSFTSSASQCPSVLLTGLSQINETEKLLF